MSCCHREGIERQFGAKTAAADLRRYRRRGPIRTTRILIELVSREGVEGASVLDVGGGVGAVYHELLHAGAREATHVDVSPDYIDAARSEAERRGTADRVGYIHGDVVERAEAIDAADIVTLDRVICCYPDAERLVSATAARARRTYGAVYPRETWWMRAALAAVNVVSRVRRSPFRVWLHPPATIDAILRRSGMERRALRRTIAWEVVVYVRR